MQKKLFGVLLGTALGDALGLPFEGLNRSKIAKKKLNHPNLIFNRGFFSDDTEQTIIVAKALILSNLDSKEFEKYLKRGLQKWFLAIPISMGFATMKSLFKSFFIKKSGVFSAGNAPAMRSAILGVIFGNSNSKLKEFVKINTEITHTDPKAFYGALAVAKASYLSSQNRDKEFFKEIKELIDDKEFLNIMQNVEENLDITTEDFALKLGFKKGVGGYIYQTIPIVIHSYQRNSNNFKEAVLSVIRCGGDTDTTGAIVGAIVGAKVEEFPKEWIKTLSDYPITPSFMEKLSYQIIEKNKKVVKNYYLLMLLRNIIFFFIILFVAIIR